MVFLVIEGMSSLGCFEGVLEEEIMQTLQDSVKLGDSLIVKLLASIFVVMIIVFGVGTVVTVQQAQNQLRNQGQRQLQAQQMQHAQQIEETRERLMRKLQPQVEMMIEFAKGPLIMQVNEVEVDANQDKRGLIDAFQSCFDNQTEESMLFHCIRTQIFQRGTTGIIASLNRTFVTNAISFLAQDEDMIGIFVEDWEEQLYAGYQKNAEGEIVAVEEIPEWPPEFSVIDKEVDDDGEYIGRVIFLYTTQRITAMEQAAATQLAQAEQLIEESIDEQSQQIAQSRLLEAIVFFLVLLVSFSMVALTTIIRPLRQLKNNADQLAKGHLDQDVEMNRQDELGNLAQSFALMRDAIRKKLHDLHVLNETGEAMAGMLDQTVALKTALQVMKAQTHVEFGSVYLLNANQELEFTACYPQHEGGQLSTPKFKLGEGIAGMAAQNKRIIYIPDTTQDSRFVTSGETPTPRALLCVPLLDDQDIFGVMNFSGTVQRVNFHREDEKFAATIARMTVVTTKNIRMINVIEEQNRTLEHKVEERTAELNQKTNDINNMLQNMHQGILTVVDGNRVHHEYSSFVGQILEREDIAGTDVMELIFENTDLGSNALDQISVGLSALIGEDSLMFAFNQHLLVTEFYKTFPEGHNKIIELDWDPIVDEDNIIEKIMLTLRDVTEIRGLQEEARRQKRELEIIGQILAVSQKKFQDFTQTSHRFLEENTKLILGASEKNPELLATLFRNMHTIKGNARTYGFHYLTDALHEAEQTYDRLRRDAQNQWDQQQLLNELDQMQDFLSEYEEIYQAKLGKFENGEGVYLDAALFEKAQHLLEKVDTQNPEKMERTIEQARGLLKAVGSETLECVLEGIVKAVPTLAEELGKAPPEIVLNANNIRVYSDITPVLKDVFMHSIRNSMDHGIEAPEERQHVGKPEAGKITLEVSRCNGHLMFTYQDDGRGLALEAIRKEAIGQGILSADEVASDEAVAQLVFNSGLSTAQKVTDISGRGVGMDAIKRFLQHQGGDIQLILADGIPDGTPYRPFRSIITLPEKHGIEVTS